VGDFLFFLHTHLPPAFKKQQFSKAERQGEHIKVTVVRESEEVRGESIEITTEIVQSFEISQLHTFRSLLVAARFV
jgi:hypothetical protein